MIFENEQKTQPITRLQIIEAFKRVRANDGGVGVDGISTKQVERNKRKYLYPLWNRMSSGSYFPKPVRQTLIPKGEGKMRALGIPTVVDRVAQQVIATELEAIVDKTFSDNSFGYRPKKSAHEAIEQCRIHCMKYSWVIDIDIKGFFDNIDHDLLMQAVQWHTEKKHILLYCQRWLEAPIQLPDACLPDRQGSIKLPQGKGTPQGGVISPVLANIFLDVVFDKWIEKRNPEVVYERYADDIVVHCQHIKEALRLLEAIKQRFKSCKLEINRDKTKIVYCRRNQKKQPPFKVRYQKFDFLGFTFKPRISKTEKGKLMLGFTPAISQKSIARINETLRKLKIHRWTYFSLSRVGVLIKSKLRGWLNYYSKFRKSELRHLFRDVNKRLAQWVRNKYRRFRGRHWYYAYKHLQGIAKSYPYMFEHWMAGFLP
jgi:group II intron reverse transcriptase/maturase